MSEPQPIKPVSAATAQPAAQQSNPTNPLSTSSSNPAQPSLFPPAPPPLPESNPSNKSTPPRSPFWLQQMVHFLFIYLRMTLGMVVCMVPWYSPFWDSNPLFSQPSGLATFIGNGAVRGLVSGLGLLNLWIAIRDAMHSPKA